MAYSHLVNFSWPRFGTRNTKVTDPLVPHPHRWWVKEALADGGPLSSLFSSNPSIATGLTAARLQDRFVVVGFLEKYAVGDIPAWGQDITRSINDAILRSGFPVRFGNIPTAQSVRGGDR